MRKIAGVVCAIVAIPVALVAMVFAAGAADPEADSAAWGLAIGAILALAATTALLAVAARALRTSSPGTGEWRRAAPLAYWLALGVAVAAVAAELARSALDELELDALFLGGAAGLLIALVLVMLEDVAWGVIAAIALILALAALGFRDGPYEPRLGYWLPRVLALLAGLAVLVAAARVRTRRERSPPSAGTRSGKG